MQMIREMIEKIGYSGMDGLILDDMIIIQDQNKVVFLPRHIIDQDCWNRIFGDRLGRAEKRQGRLPYSKTDRLAGRNEIGPEPDRVVVRRIQG